MAKDNTINTPTQTTKVWADPTGYSSLHTAKSAASSSVLASSAFGSIDYFDETKKPATTYDSDKYSTTKHPPCETPYSKPSPQTTQTSNALPRPRLLT